MARQQKVKTRREKVRLWKVDTGLGPINLMHARYVTQNFAPHFHEGYCIGVIEKGALKFRYRGENVVAPSGSVNLAVPGEVHTGHAADKKGWTYRMFYLDTDLIASASSQMTDINHDTLFIPDGVLFDPELAAEIHQLHCLMEDPGTPLIEKETGLLEVLTLLRRRHCVSHQAYISTGNEPKAVETAKAYLHAYHDRDVSVREVAETTGLSPYHFIRVFSKETGLTPHAYLTQVRVQKVKQLLQSGETAVQAAVSAGFFDQSHLTRHFKRIVGMPPGSYRNSVQDSASVL